MTTSERLIEAATAEFADKGLKDANLRDICALADVNLNAVRYHFGGKEALYVAAVKHAPRSVMGDIRPPSDESTPPE
ncbi:TetR/AcrR family transcriptional regulator, partial [Rhodopirellula bahusiensis]|uniref:TetR/AcrR family transcriptional regulator n=1 Tax=Rhodopirellula bahusiensis TaxID=2014065 RepID=UPI0032987225